MAFRVSGKSIEIENPVLPTEPFVLFGVRACDARSFDVLDRVFLSDPVDSYYEARRNCGTVVSLGCLEPLRETCFCSVFGIDLAEPEGDVQAMGAGRRDVPECQDRKGRKAAFRRQGPLRGDRRRAACRRQGRGPRQDGEKPACRPRPHRL